MTVIATSSSLSLYSSLVGLVILFMVYAPQEWKRDRRALVGLALLVGGLIGKTAYAAVITPGVCSRPWGWVILECWL